MYWFEMMLYDLPYLLRFDSGINCRSFPRFMHLKNWYLVAYANAADLLNLHLYSAVSQGFLKGKFYLLTSACNTTRTKSYPYLSL